MNTLRKYRKFVGGPLIAAVMAIHVPFNAAHAAMVGTDEIVAPSVQTQDRTQGWIAPAEARARVDAMLERGDVQAQLRAWGIDADEAKRRAAALSDAEIASLAQRIGEDPSGKGVIGVVIVVAVVAFFVLLITDMAGATDVFPFVHSKNERK